MKTEEIKPGDILYEKERKLLVKVARVDEDGVIKYSAYTDMQRIFKTVPPPYRIGTHSRSLHTGYRRAAQVYGKRTESVRVCKSA